MAPPLLTLRAIAQSLRIPESTVRYYRDAFAELIPTVGRGRRRRHPPDVLPLFALIAEGFAASWSRDDIRAALVDRAEPGGTALPTTTTTPSVAVVHQAPSPADDLLAVVLEGEAERREAMWQLAREMVRLGEAVERQHAVLCEMARHLERRPALGPMGSPGTTRVPAGELDALRTELERERELVERLRRSKLDIERRAAEAEAALADTREGPLRRMFGSRQPGPGAS
jgi:hypothetical protein